MNLIKKGLLLSLMILPLCAFAQSAKVGDDVLRETLYDHSAFVNIPNLPQNKDLMMKNIDRVASRYEALGFSTSLLETATLPLLLTEKQYDPGLKTILFYFHIDGQPVDAKAWDQPDPFSSVLKRPDKDGKWQTIPWDRLEGPIDDEWRIFARAAADDKAPITMFLKALEIMQEVGETPAFNIKVIFDPEEEYGSKALLSTLSQYADRYASDYFIVMDGPSHTSNLPTLTFGCRGIATCSLTTYGARLPQHSGHYGNYVPNPVFHLSRLLAGMKDDSGKVLIEDYYKGVEISSSTASILSAVPFDAKSLNESLGINTSEKVGDSYQEALQYPSLNVRQLGTSWKGQGLKTVIPEYAEAFLDVRLVPEIEMKEQLERIRVHLRKQGYRVLDRDPTDAERLQYPRLVKFKVTGGVNAFRTSPESGFGQK
ncbi:MAG: M20/M25/M40 family metallo-hydrolase, partial [Bacteroidota bacterium]